MQIKMFGRRHFSWGHFLFRIPLILVWTIVVMLVFYKSITSISLSGDNEPDIQVSPWATHEALSREQRETANQIRETLANQLLIPDTSLTIPDLNKQENKPSMEPPRSVSDTTSSLTTTRRSPIRDYVRHSEIFILIIQEEGIINEASKAKIRPSLSNFYPNSQSSLHAGSSHHKLPSHIDLLIDILKYHRIDYSLATMRTGLPRELLQNPKRYSVIVIDDFFKYDQLNRWARDQLDRFCRTNQISVITYSLDNGKFGLKSDTTESRTVSNPASGGSENRCSAKWKVSLKQYPMTFELYDLGRKPTSPPCLVDYQLNDQTKFLRLIKSKPNYILRGDLSALLSTQSSVTMMSNHATHEPLTWSRCRKLQTLSLSEGSNFRHQEDSTRIHKRAALPDPALVTWSGPEDGGEILPGDPRQSNNEEYYGQDIDDVKEKPSDHNDGDETHDQTDDLPDSTYDRKVVAMLDNGLYDGIQRVIFGVSNKHWLNRMLLLDAIEHLSMGQILTPLERYIQIDIDDIFVGATGMRLNESDVAALIETQDRFASFMEGEFKFNLGFSGKFFMRGNEAEKLGDKQLIANADKFTWFCHFWSHSKAHLFNSTEALSVELRKNLKFASDNGLTLIGRRRNENASLEGNNQQPTYAVAPHHSGVYPIQAELYAAWRAVLNVQVTTTEEYPHLRPANQRRGFVHEAIKVLPRQTCGLYTHTIFRDKYPGGFGRLLASIKGGELFETVLHNPVNIFMTHMSNYGNDRLAPFTFGALFEFVNKYTNIRLRYSPVTPAGGQTAEDAPRWLTSGGPMFLADYHFRLHPEEREPLWTNPCSDKRHLSIWAPKKLSLCRVVPKLLIVGPQKTGTTALQFFLTLNPSVRTSVMSSDDFEEVQFFNDKHYLKGSDWYFERFRRDNHTQSDRAVYLDKSATYFDDPRVPRRASSLLPDAHIVILLTNPADRAYSWYEHIKAHGDPVANELAFDEVIMFQNASDARRISPSATPESNDTTGTMPGQWSTPRQHSEATKALRARCLHPGYYSNHILRWLDHYEPRQVVIVDGEWLRLNPKAVLSRLQLLLRLPTQVDYDRLLVYQPSKGFYCARTDRASMLNGGAAHSRKRSAGIQCLGSGKGRKYGPMSANARKYLDDHYLSHNRQLAKLLYEIGQPLPRWLDKAINPLLAAAA